MTFGVQNPQLLTKEYLLAEISDIDELSIEESNEYGMLLWDDEDAKNIPVRFIENLSPDLLAGLIHISSDIPSAYQVDRTALALYLWDVCDKNAFITLEEIVVIWSEPDDPNTYEPSGFVDEQSKRLYEKYYDDYAYEIGSGYLGQLWFERNTVMINMGEIVRTAKETARENKDLFDPYFSFEQQVEIGFLTTVLHEMRHLQMDTNIFLPEEDYPLELSSEKAVEEYCREAFDSADIPLDIFPNLYEEEHQTSLGINTKGNGECYYHVTLIENVPSIRNRGLIPSIGERSKGVGETEPFSYLFASEEDLGNALMGWLGDWYSDNYGDDCKLAILHIHLPHDIPVFDYGTGFERVCKTTIPPEFISFYDEQGNELADPHHHSSLESKIQAALSQVKNSTHLPQLNTKEPER